MKPVIYRPSKEVRVLNYLKAHFSTSLANMRQARGDTLEQFSAYTGITVTSISRYERRCSDVPIEIAIRLGFISFAPGANFQDKPFASSAKKEEEQVTIFEVVK